MDTNEIDKETIIASSSESESRNNSRRKDRKKRNKSKIFLYSRTLK